jgi:hypothetical protein
VALESVEWLALFSEKSCGLQNRQSGWLYFHSKFVALELAERLASILEQRSGFRIGRVAGFIFRAEKWL